LKTAFFRNFASITSIFLNGRQRATRLNHKFVSQEILTNGHQLFGQETLTKMLFKYSSLVVDRSGFMKKLVVVLSITIVILGIVNGFLFYQLNAIQNLNSEQRSKNVEIQNQLDELQIQNDELENQIAELQTQNSEFQNQISEQETQLSKYTNLVKITEVTIESGIYPYIGLTLYNEANVTIENL